MFTKGFDAIGTSIAGFRILNIPIIISELRSNVPTARNMLIYEIHIWSIWVSAIRWDGSKDSRS